MDSKQNINFDKQINKAILAFQDIGYNMNVNDNYE